MTAEQPAHGGLPNASARGEETLAGAQSLQLLGDGLRAQRCYCLSVFEWKKITLVAEFEFRDAVRSRLVAFALLLFAIGAGLGAVGFLHSVSESQQAAREMLAAQAGIPPEEVPIEEIRGRALSWLMSFVEDESLRESLLKTEPLALFFGYAALALVPGLVLFLTAGAHATDIANGSTRYVLFRISRADWAIGKLLSQLAILALSLLLAAVVTFACAVYVQGSVTPGLALDLLIAALRPLPLGFCYLGWFAGVALFIRVPMKARALSLGVLFVAFLGHLVTSSDYLQETSPVIGALRFLFPGEYETGLWMPSVLSWGSATLALSVLALAGFAAGVWSFERKDA